jgi:hypothetical protein
MSDKAEIKEIERLTYDVPEAGAMCGLNRVRSYIAAKRGDIPVIVVGGRLKVPAKHGGPSSTVNRR